MVALDEASPSTDLIVVDREDAGTKLLNWLYAEASAISVQAEAPGEAIAFLFASIQQLPEGNRDSTTPWPLLPQTPTPPDRWRMWRHH